MYIPLKNICIGILFTFCFFLSQAQNNTPKKKAFTLTGNINSSAEFYSSNEGDSVQTRPGYAWNIYGSFMPKINKISLPFSFVITDYKQSGKSPYIQAGISPTYKWMKLHFGVRTIQFSPLIFDGRSFTGAGVELNPKIFRFAAFYGRLNKAVSEDTIKQNIPRYKRMAYGARVGIGNILNYFDLIYFHAKDDSNSVSFIKRSGNPGDIDSTQNAIRPQENAVFGSSFKLTFYKKFVLTGDFAVSGLTQNLSADTLNLDSAYQYKKLVDFTNNFITVNASSFASIAGQSSLSYYSRYFNAAFSYRRVQPNFNSLGTPYIINDIELFSFNNNFSVAKGKLSFNSGISHQHNDLEKNLNNEVKTWSGNVGVNAIVSKHLNVNANYFGYSLKQTNGREAVTDSVNLQQSISQFNIAPSYNFTKENMLHFISGNFNYSTLNNKMLLTASQNISNNLSASLSYTLGLIKQACNFSISGLYNKYKLDTNAYNSSGINIGSSAAFLKEKNLSLQGSVGFYFNSYKANSSSNNTSNLSYSFNAGYTAKRHTFNLFMNYLYTPPKIINNTINKTFQYAVAFKSFTGSISYNYRF